MGTHVLRLYKQFMSSLANDSWDGTPPPSMANPALLREPPATERGARTRSALISAARTVFERDGYLDAHLGAITRAANCSTGTFYTYFRSKEEIFAAVLADVQEDMLHPGMGRVADDADPYVVLAASNRAYLEAYRRNAKLMALLEQVASVDPVFRELRRRRGEAFVHRNARGIADLQRRGIADPSLDPMLTSQALSSMVSRVAYSVFTSEDKAAVDFDHVVDTVTRLWANALRLPSHS
jgi:AcrR family transcriptional regulator